MNSLDGTRQVQLEEEETIVYLEKNNNNPRQEAKFGDLMEYAPTEEVEKQEKDDIWLQKVKDVNTYNNSH